MQLLLTQATIGLMLPEVYQVKLTEPLCTKIRMSVVLVYVLCSILVLKEVTKCTYIHLHPTANLLSLSLSLSLSLPPSLLPLTLPTPLSTGPHSTGVCESCSQSLW